MSSQLRVGTCRISRPLPLYGGPVVDDMIKDILDAYDISELVDKMVTCQSRAFIKEYARRIYSNYTRVAAKFKCIFPSEDEDHAYNDHVGENFRVHLPCLKCPVGSSVEEALKLVEYRAKAMCNAISAKTGIPMVSSMVYRPVDFSSSSSDDAGSPPVSNRPGLVSSSASQPINVPVSGLLSRGSNPNVMTTGVDAATSTAANAEVGLPVSSRSAFRPISTSGSASSAARDPSDDSDVTSSSSNQISVNTTPLDHAEDCRCFICGRRVNFVDRANSLGSSLRVSSSQSPQRSSSAGALPIDASLLINATPIMATSVAPPVSSANNTVALRATLPASRFSTPRRRSPLAPPLAPVSAVLMVQVPPFNAAAESAATSTAGSTVASSAAAPVSADVGGSAALAALTALTASVPSAEIATNAAAPAPGNAENAAAPAAASADAEAAGDGDDEDEREDSDDDDDDWDHDVYDDGDDAALPPLRRNPRADKCLGALLLFRRPFEPGFAMANLQRVRSKYCRQHLILVIMHLVYVPISPTFAK